MEEELKILEDFIKYYEAEAISRKFRGTLSISVDEQDIQALENLLTRYKDIKRINSDLQGEQEQLYNKIDKLEEKNKHLSSVSDYETISMQCNHLEELLDIAEDRVKELEKENEEWQRAYQEEKDKHFELLRENKELKEDNEQLEAIKDEAIRRYNFETILKSKVIELMEELKTKPLKINENDKYYYETEVYNKIVIQVLQELLRGGEVI